MLPCWWSGAGPLDGKTCRSSLPLCAYRTPSQVRIPQTTTCTCAFRKVSVHVHTIQPRATARRTLSVFACRYCSSFKYADDAADTVRSDTAGTSHHAPQAPPVSSGLCDAEDVAPSPAPAPAPAPAPTPALVPAPPTGGGLERGASPVPPSSALDCLRVGTPFACPPA